MATNPTLKVEIAFVSTPLDIAPTWVDVSAYVRQSPGVSIRRGRQSELDNFDAGTCQITLSNRDRRFDPSYAAGPYFGNLFPRNQIRVTATWAAVDYVMFRGWVTGWPQSFAPSAGKDATVTIEAIDALAWLANNNLPPDKVYDYANTTIGSLAFFLRGATTSLWSDATGNGYSATLYNGTGQTSGSLMSGSESPSVSFDGLTLWKLAKQWRAVGAWSISFLMQATKYSDIVAAGDPTASAPYLLVGRTELGAIYLIASATAPPSTWELQSPDNFMGDGIPHHVVITSNGSARTSNKMYVDGVDTLAANTVGVNPPMGLLDWLGGLPPTSLTYFKGGLQDVAGFNKQLSAAEVLGLYQRSVGYLPETSTARCTRILDDVGWPATWRNLTTTPQATVGELVYNGSNANALLQEVQRSEQGWIFASAGGNLTLLDHLYSTNVATGNTSQQIFTDEAVNLNPARVGTARVGTARVGTSSLPYSTFGFQYNDIDITNDATVTTPTTWAKSSDATSITRYGLQSKKVDTILTTFAAANAMAAELVARGKTAAYRVAPILVYPMRNTDRWDNVLALELAQRITIRQTPMAVGSQNAQDVAIESIEWLIQKNLWTLIVAGSPV